MSSVAMFLVCHAPRIFLGSYRVQQNIIIAILIIYNHRRGNQKHFWWYHELYSPPTTSIFTLVFQSSVSERTNLCWAKGLMPVHPRWASSSSRPPQWRSPAGCSPSQPSSTSGSCSTAGPTLSSTASWEQSKITFIMAVVALSICCRQFWCFQTSIIWAQPAGSPSSIFLSDISSTRSSLVLRNHIYYILYSHVWSNSMSPF